MSDVSISSPFMLIDDFRNLCNQKEFGISTKDEQDELTKWLLKIGFLLTFSDSNEQIKYVVLNPSWLTSVVFSFHNSNKIFFNGAVITNQILENDPILQKYKKEDKKLVINQMQKHGLCIDISVTYPDESGYLMPTLIDEKEPHYGDLSANGIELVYNYKSYYPIHIIPHIAARLYHYLHKKTYWQEGCWLKHGEKDQAIALVKYIPISNTIQVKIEGEAVNKRIELNFLIRETIQKINEEFSFGTPSVHMKPDLFEKAQLIFSSPSYSGLPKSLPQKFVGQVKKFIPFPRIIGRFIFDLFGRRDVADLSSIILGWGMIFISILMILRFIKIDRFIEFFIYNWRFFFPVKP